MFRNLTIKARLVGVIAFLSLQLLVGGAIGIVSLGDTSDSMKSMYDDCLVSLGQLDRVVRMLDANEALISEALTGEQSKIPQVVLEVNRRTVQIDKVWADYMGSNLAPEEKKVAEEFIARRNTYATEGVKPALDAMQMHDTQAATKAVHGPMTTLYEPVRALIDSLIELQLAEAKQKYEKAQSTYRLVRNSCVTALVFGILLAALVGSWLVLAITRPLNAAVKLATRIAKGDLTQSFEVWSNDEAGRLMQALKDMRDSLAQIVSQVRNGTDTMATASSQIAAGNQDLSSRTEQQASSLEETASSLEELTSTVRQNADNAHQANQLAVSASDVASKGGAVVSQVVNTMASINQSSKKIADIIGVIDGIAFQTNILALNAAVEAARAGEQGKGFAVVASEVRSLAQRSANAAREIKDLIGNSVEQVETGTKLVDQAGATMREIVESIRHVTDIMGEIAAASAEQTAGIDQINKAVSQMDQVTQQNASLVEEAAAASEVLQEQAGALARTVSLFNLSSMEITSHPHAQAGSAVFASRLDAVEKRPAGTAPVPVIRRSQPEARALPPVHDDRKQF